MSDCAEHTLPERSNNPKTQETKQTCKVLLGFIQETIGDQAQSILCDTVDEVLIVLKNDKLRDKDHKNEIETFLIRKIPEQHDKTEKEDEDIDEIYAVNVEFEDSDDEDEDAKMNYTIEEKDF
ncbi:unnamed protein product [Rotaria sp. Silwood1]|nr:unnamed protein product [Rotaria sp. Silwood1]